ncbi:hypothetical protein RCOM_0560070 [Ricinus communis]|uniref:Uncharacterized protein n=1 Tax=Ricinus communis TaxID=3988 RepID=B9S2Q4_RICCO|nr:hypothetical protein RCOM_0560070 [Ricinus communis]
MDKNQEQMQFLSLLAIYREAYQIISSHKKIFTQITIYLILSLSFFSSSRSQAIKYFLCDKDHHPRQCQWEKLSNSFFSDMTNSWLFKIGYCILILVFSSLSTAAVAYATTCAYIGQGATFKKVKDVVFKFFPHNLCYGLQAFGCQVRAVSYTHNETRHWSNQIYNWISVHKHNLADGWCLFRIRRRRKALIKGKIWINTTVFLTMSMFVMFIRGEYRKLFVHGSLIDLISEVPLVILCFWFLCQLILFGLTVQTVTYFVCKSYHHEIIDPSALLDNLQLHPHATKDACNLQKFK